MWSNACHAVTVEVDPDTGTVEILRYVVSEDCGMMINPNIVEGQIAGGVAQGIGGVLYEHNVYDDDGNPLASTFLDYLVPTVAEIPDIECHHIETPAATRRVQGRRRGRCDRRSRRGVQRGRRRARAPARHHRARRPAARRPDTTRMHERSGRGS